MRAWLALVWLATARAQLTNLALGRVPFGSAESYAQGFEKVTDGDLTSQWSSHARPPVTTRPAWRIPEPAFVQAPPVASVATWRLPDFKEMLGDYPGVLLVDLGAPSQIDHMRLYSAVEAGGFETLKVYRSVDGLSWPLVRAESNRFHCSPGVMSHHHGWPEETRYVLLEMQDRCSGRHPRDQEDLVLLGFIRSAQECTVPGASPWRSGRFGALPGWRWCPSCGAPGRSVWIFSLALPTRS